MAFAVRGRKAWGARPATSITQQAVSTVDYLVVHHTAGRAPALLHAAKREMRSIQDQHMAQGWSDIGYNFVIDRWGRVWEGRGYYRVGAHTKGQNTGSIGVSFMGNYEHLKLNRRQIRAYELLLQRLRGMGFRFDAVRGHRDMPNQATACPGKNIMRQLNL